MNLQTVLTFTVVAGLTIATPGPAILLSVRNSTAYGVRSVAWSALGNISGVFCLSSAAVLGLGVLLMSSALLFGALKLLGALYLFYLGLRSLCSRSAALLGADASRQQTAEPGRARLVAEAFFTAATNPKALLFFTALFPQFIDARAALLPQFFILTGIFMGLAYGTHLAYATAAARATQLLQRPSFSKWMNRLVGATFIAFGGLLLSLRRQAA